jgi:hypothetical protein
MNTGVNNHKKNLPYTLLRQCVALVGRWIRWLRLKMAATGGTNGIWL